MRLALRITLLITIFSLAPSAFGHIPPGAGNIFETDRRGNVVRTMDAAHVWFTNSFDGLDRVKWAAGPQIVFTNPPAFTFPPPPPPVQQAITNYFDAAGIVVTNVNALGEKTVTKKDALSRDVSVAIYAASGSLVRTSATVYAANHHSSTAYAGSGASAIRTTLFTDNAGQPLLTLKYPNSGLTEFTLQAYDVAGNRTELRECSITNGQVTTWATNFWTYDNLNRVRTETVKDGVTTTFKYDAAGNQTNRVMPGNFEWRASYNTAGRITKDYDISGTTGANTNTYLYYTSGPFIGLPQTKTDGRAVVCTYGYDQFLRLTTNAHDGPLAEHDLTVAKTYDARGLLIELRQWFASAATGASNYMSRSYTPYGQLLSEANRIDGMLHSDWRQYWDNGGRRQGLGSMAFGYQFGWRADGSVSSVSSPRLNSGATYTYDTAGQLLTRSSGNSRVTTFNQRDGTGRPQATTTTVHGVTKLTESLSWRADGRLLAHTVGRNGDFTNQQEFAYANWTRRLTEERLNLTGTQKWTNTFAYDGGQASKLGVLTKAGNVSQGSALWSGTADALHRIANETNNVLRLGAEGDVNGFAYVDAYLDGRPMPVTSFVNSNGGSWRANLELTPGAHQLQASALHPFMLFTNWATNYFTNSVSALTATVVYDASGQISQKIWKIGSVTNRIQTLTWDGKGRLFKLAERDTNNSGINWTATYDALGRRLRTTSVTVTNGVTNSAFPTVISQYFDPEFAFLELGVDVNGETTWKLYGPDLSGTYGGLNGVGGLEAIAPPPDLYCPVMPDARGNLHGVYDQRHLELMWFPSRVTGYGAVPGYRPNALGHGAMVDSSSAWGGMWPDITGLIWMKRRYYDPEAGRFLSPDPFGPESDPSRYTYADGDPINFIDPFGLSPMPSLGVIERYPDAQSPRFPDAGGWLGAGVGRDWLGLGFQPGLAGWREGNQYVGLPIAPPDVSDLFVRETADANTLTPQERRIFNSLPNYNGSGLREPSGLTWRQQWQSNPSLAFENTLKEAASLSLMAVPWTAPARVASFGLRTELMFAERAVLGSGARAEITALQRFHPANNGFLGATEQQFLMRGQRIDRYGGSDHSRFFSPVGTPLEARSLPPQTAIQPLRTFEVLKPFPVEAGRVAPAHGQIGFGAQYRSPVTLQILLKRGIIREVR